MKNKADNKIFPNRGPKFAQPAYAGAGANTAAYMRAQMTDVRGENRSAAAKYDFGSAASSIDLVGPCAAMLGRWTAWAAKLVRVLTVPPVWAAVMTWILHIALGVFPGSQWLLPVMTLSVLPLLAYPVARLVPAIHKRGREGERSLAVVFSMAGYVLGAAVCLVLKMGKVETVIHLTYLFSVVIIAIGTFVLKKKVSGHTCGLSGPLAVLTLLVSPWYLLGYLLVTVVMWSSVALKRHTLGELMAGAVAPILSMVVAYLL